MFEVAFVVVAILINTYILRYLHHLEDIGCKCAMNWRRKFIMFFIGASLLVAVFSLFKVDILTSSIVLTVFAGLSIANIVVILQYIHMLKAEKCSCSNDLAREILQLIAALYAFCYIMLFIVLFYSGFRIAAIRNLSKQLATNNPQVVWKAMRKTFGNATRSIRRSSK